MLCLFFLPNFNVNAKITVNPFTPLRIRKDAARHTEILIFRAVVKFYKLFTDLAHHSVTFAFLKQTYIHETDFLVTATCFNYLFCAKKQKVAKKSRQNGNYRTAGAYRFFGR